MKTSHRSIIRLLLVVLLSFHASSCKVSGDGTSALSESKVDCLAALVLPGCKEYIKAAFDRGEFGFHVTAAENIDSIRQKGLLTSFGGRSQNGLCGILEQSACTYRDRQMLQNAAQFRKESQGKVHFAKDFGTLKELSGWFEMNQRRYGVVGFRLTGIQRYEIDPDIPQGGFRTSQSIEPRDLVYLGDNVDSVRQSIINTKTINTKTCLTLADTDDSAVDPFSTTVPSNTLDTAATADGSVQPDLLDSASEPSTGFQLAGDCKGSVDDSVRKQTAKDVKEVHAGVKQLDEIEKGMKAATKIAEKTKYSEAAAQIAVKLEPTAMRLGRAVSAVTRVGSKAVPYVGEVAGIIYGFVDAAKTFKKTECLPGEVDLSCNLHKTDAAAYSFAQGIFMALPPQEERTSDKDRLVVLLKSMFGVYSVDSIRKAFTAKATCQEGYEPVGSLLCRKMGCPAYYKDQGATCFRGAQIEQANNSACPAANKCGLSGLAGAGCSTCRDPSFHNDGCTCRRDPDLIWKEVRGGAL